MNSSSKITRALFSVSDKTGIGALAAALHFDHGVEILSTGGTAVVLRERGIRLTDVSQYTGFPEMLNGRVKTLHPKIHGGLLYVRGNTEHETTASHHGILPIDLVVVNLYPFQDTVAKPGVTRAEVIEQIDIGGPSMLRSAAKNHESVTAIVDPADYEELIREMSDLRGATSLAFRRRLAEKVFEVTASYDAAIRAYLRFTAPVTTA